METAQTLDSPLLETQYFGTLLHQCLSHGLALALYHKPNDPHQHCLIDLHEGRDLKTVDIETLGQGFVFYPFEYTEVQPGKFIRADVHLINDASGFVAKSENDENLLKLQVKLDQTPTNKGNLNCIPNGNAQAKNGSEAVYEQHYKKIVAEAVRQINMGAFQKVVLARNKKISLPGDFDVYALFLSLCNQYPQSFVSLVFTPETGMWIGATPEILIQQNENNIFYTTALAGTQAHDPAKHLSEASWTQKDIEEQALVSRYIINCFKKIRLREYDEVGPKTMKAGNLLHLKTDYFVDINQLEFPQLASVMLDLLHPTSAVCGMPKEPALGFINDSEGFRRMYYSGHLGPVNIDGSTDIYVNLRCMKLENDQAELFAGAGVTADSDPDKEWLETEWKFGTLMDVLKKIL